MKSITLFLLLFPFPLTVLASEQENVWKKVKDKQGIQVYRAHNENTRLKTFKAVTRFEIDNLLSFVGLLLDGDGYTNWIHMVGESEVKPTENPLTYEFYLVTRLPWPVTDRLLKSDYVITQSDDYSIRFELFPPKIPAEVQKGTIVVPESSGYYEIKTFPNSKEVEVTAEFFIDPGGFVPTLLVNLITDDMSYYTTKKMRAYLTGEKYKDFNIDSLKRRPWVE